MAGTRSQVEGLPWYRAARGVGVGVDDDAMDQIDTGSLVDRARCVVTEDPANAIYEYDQDSVAVADGFNVVAPASGVGRWILVSVAGADSFVYQSAWYVDPATGDDANAGDTALTAIKTLSELARRWAGRVLSPTVLAANVYLAAGTYPDPLVFTPTLPLQTQVVTVRGTMTSHFAGTITAFTAFNAATATRMQFTDAAADFSTLRRRIRMTSGAANDGLSWYGSINGVTTAQPNAFVNPGGTSPSTVTPAIGDTYVVESCASSVPYVFVESDGAGLVIVRDLRFVAASGFRCYLNGGGSGTRVRLAGCELESTAAIALLAGTVTLAGCCATGANGVGMTSYNGIVLHGMSFLGGSLNQLQQGYFLGNNVMHDGNGQFAAGLSLVNGALMEDIGTQSGHAFFGCLGGTALVSLDDFSRWVLSSASARFWGSAGNTAGAAIKVFNGSGFMYVTLPTATGVAPGTDVILAGAAGVAWATMPAVAGGAGNTAYVSVRQ